MSLFSGEPDKNGFRDVETGARLEGVIEEARAISSREGVPVKFRFRGCCSECVHFVITASSNPELIMRDWQRSYSGALKGQIGPTPNPTLTRQEKVLDAYVWESKHYNQLERTSDWHQVVMAFALNWANIMQSEVDQGKSLGDVVESSAQVAGADAVSPHQYIAAVKVLRACWMQGVDLDRWHYRNGYTTNSPI